MKFCGMFLLQRNKRWLEDTTKEELRTMLELG
jgi:hypothetical protein